MLCAGAPDTPEIAAEMKAAVAAAQRKHSGVVWIEEMVGHQDEDPSSIATQQSFRLPFDLRTVWNHQSRRRWPAQHRWWPPLSAASGGSSSMERQATWCPLTRCRRVHLSRSLRERFSRDLAARINELMADPAKRKAFV